MILFSGIVFGWGSFVYVLKHDGIFYHLCAKDAINSTDTQLDASTRYGVESNQSVVHNDPGAKSLLDVQCDDASANSSIQTTKKLCLNDASYSETSERLVTCPAQDNMLALCFSVSAATLYTATSVAGALTYACGTRLTRLVGWYVTLISSEDRCIHSFIHSIIEGLRHRAELHYVLSRV